MDTVRLPDALRDALEYLEGENLDNKLAQVVMNDLKRRLQTCSQRIVDFEAKYGMEFEEFTHAWRAAEIPNRHSHEVERDYMEWESLHDEFKQLLSQLERLKIDIFYSASTGRIDFALIKGGERVFGTDIHSEKFSNTRP